MRSLLALAAIVAAVVALSVVMAAPPPGPATPPPPPPIPPVPPPPPPPPPKEKTVHVVVTPANFTKIFSVVHAPGATLYVLKPEYSSAVIVMEPGVYKVLDKARTYIVFEGESISVVAKRAAIVTNVLASVDAKLVIKGLGIAVEALVAYAHPHKASTIVLKECALKALKKGSLVIEPYAEDAALTAITAIKTKISSPIKALIVAKTPPATSSVTLVNSPVKGGITAIGFGPGTSELKLSKCGVAGPIHAKTLTLLALNHVAATSLNAVSVGVVSVSYVAIAPNIASKVSSASSIVISSS